MSLGVGAGRAGGHLADHRAAVAVLPTRPRVVPADRLAGDKQRRDRLAELPHELPAGIGLALVDLSALRMNRGGDGLPGALIASGTCADAALVSAAAAPTRAPNNRVFPYT